ncbi:MAG: acyl-CoA dehydrogenase [Candidatus Binatia bacterium]|nr:MAG: acyl-CoA dehydrogenase [Candidatus Binatia bacterium]
MLQFDIDRETQQMLEIIGWLGREHMRPLGLEADRQHRPIPPDHPFFELVWKLGIGRRVWGDDERAASGQRFTTRRNVLLAEEMSYWDRGVAVALPGPGLGGPPIALLGTPEQKKRFLGIFNDPDKPHWGAFAMTEPGAGSDVAAIRTRARRQGDYWVLDGEKMFCSNGARADWVVVWATVDPALGREGHRAFVVERGTPGFRVDRIENKMGLIAYESAALVFEECRVPGANLLGGEESYRERAGFKGAMQSFNATRPVVAAMAIGIARAAYDHARDFVRAAYASSRPLPRYRRMLDKLAWIERKIACGRLLCWQAAYLADVQQPNVAEASMAKAYCPQVAQEATALAMEIVADTGATKDGLVEKWFRDVKAMDIVEGTGQIQRRIIARHLTGLPEA